MFISVAFSLSVAKILQTSEIYKVYFKIFNSECSISSRFISKIVIWRVNNDGSVPKRSNDDPKVFQSVPTDEEKLLEVIKETPSISRAELSKRLKISERQVRKITDQLREKGVLIREGGNAGKWIINKL